MANLSRRTVARGMAWTAPVVLTSVHAPAVATSTMPCLECHAALEQTSSPVTTLAFSNSTVTANLSCSAVDDDGYDLSDPTPGETGEIHLTQCAQGHHVDDRAHGTCAKSAPDDHRHRQVHDPRRARSLGRRRRHTVPASHPPDGGFTVPPGGRGSNVVGDGTATSPFTGSTDENIETSAGDVTLSWAGPLKIVTIAYKEAVRDNVGVLGQQIGVGQISFTTC
jgi:hypothetical protein